MQTKTRNALNSNHYTHIGIVHTKKKLHQLFINQCLTSVHLISPQVHWIPTEKELFLYYSNHYLSTELLLYNQCTYTEYQIKSSPESCLKLLTYVSWLA